MNRTEADIRRYVLTKLSQGAITEQQAGLMLRHHGLKPLYPRERRISTMAAAKARYLPSSNRPPNGAEIFGGRNPRVRH